jgi:small-conductance mechanosensitive channel
MQNIDFVSYAGSILRICVLMIGGIPLVRWCSSLLMIFCTKRFSQHIGLLVGNIVFYSGLIFVIVTVLHEFGFNVAALLGAAGVLGIAVGFASQTSVSNIISGFFLLLERPFSVGDVIKSGDVVGYVEAVDLLSVRVRTFDNKMVRLPNEMVLKHTLNNLTYYPIKRIDCVISLPYAYEVDKAQQLIHQFITQNQLFLTDPVPVVMMHKVAQHDYDTEIRTFLTIRVWVATDKFRSAAAILMEQLKDLFDKNDIIITIVHINQ